MKEGCQMKTITDQLGRTITYHFPPQRIISFAPAITETMFHLNLQEKIVGRTRFCVHPKGMVEHAVNVGGTKDVKMDRVHDLQPDLIIVEKEENTKEMVAQLEQYYPVYAFEIQTVPDAIQMIVDLGKIVDRELQAKSLVQQINKSFAEFPRIYEGKRVAYVIWQDPYMVVGKNTYIQSLLEKLGFINPFAMMGGRYPTVKPEDFQQAQLDYVLLATEPFPFRKMHLSTFAHLAPEATIKIVDGEMFWYGVKMLEAVPYFQTHLQR